MHVHVCVFLQMSLNLTTPSLPLRLKRVDFEDPQDSDAFKCKRPRLSQPPSPGLAPCLRPLSQSHGPAGPEKHCVSHIGPYVLLELTEGTHTYRAVHRITEQEYTCKVSTREKPSPLQILGCGCLLAVEWRILQMHCLMCFSTKK